MHKNRDTLKVLSKQAAESFLKSAGKSSLKAELKKIASAEHLAPVQIPVLTGEANQIVWKHLYDLNKQASYAFVPVNPDEVVGELQTAKAPLRKQASEDYMLPPEGSNALKKEASGSWSATIPTNGHQKLAGDKRLLKHEMQNRLEKTALASERLQDEEIRLHSQVEQLEIKFIKEARQLLLQEEFSERHLGIQKIAGFVRAAIPVKHKNKAALLIAKIAHVMKIQGLCKIAELQAPEEYINYDIPAKIINGNHSLYITIETLGGKWDEQEHMRQCKSIVDGTLPQLKEKIRGL